MSESTRENALRLTLLLRSQLWEKAAARVRRLASKRTNDAADATAMADDYRMLAHDVSKVRRLLPDSRAREYLEATYAQAHASLHRPAWHAGYAALNLFRDDIPAVMRWLRPHILWATGLFILTVIAG